MMKWTECRATRQQIDQTDLGGLLSDKTLRHLASCAACSEFRDERGRLRGLLGSLEPVAAPADFDVRLRARIAAQQGRGPRPFLAGFVLSTPAMAAAAVIVIMIVATVWFIQRSPNQAPTVASSTQEQKREEKSTATDAPPAAARETIPVTSDGGNQPAYLVRGGTRSPNQIKQANRALPGRSNDFSASAAQSIRQDGPNANGVSVTAPLQPMVLSWQDEKGATRRISLPPVSFGSQRLLESRVIPVSSPSRIW